MTHPTNTDLADALREIANTLPLGSALVVRLAADRLGVGEDADGWIAWCGDPKGPDLPPLTMVVVMTIGGGEVLGGETVEWWRSGLGFNNWDKDSGNDVITHYRVVQ